MHKFDFLKIRKFDFNLPITVFLIYQKLNKIMPIFTLRIQQKLSKNILNFVLIINQKLYLKIQKCCNLKIPKFDYWIVNKNRIFFYQIW